MRLTLELDPSQESALAALGEEERRRFQATVESLVRTSLEGFARADEAGPSEIRSTPGVMGGDACVGDTRIPVWLLVAYKSSGASDAEILRDYPSLTPADLGAAWAFYASDPRRIEGERRRHERDEP